MQRFNYDRYWLITFHVISLSLSCYFPNKVKFDVEYPNSALTIFATSLATTQRV